MSGYQTKGQLIVLNPRTGSDTVSAHTADHNADPGACRTEMRPKDCASGAEIIAGPGCSAGDRIHSPENTRESGDVPAQKGLTYHDLFGGTEIADAIVRVHQDVLMHAARLKK